MPVPTAIIVGQSQAAFAVDLQKLKAIYPQGHVMFLEGNVGLIKSIHEICESIQILLESKQIDLLYMSQAFLPFDGRRENAEGLDSGPNLRPHTPGPESLAIDEREWETHQHHGRRRERQNERRRPRVEALI
jgi:hypothetical protein